MLSWLCEIMGYLPFYKHAPIYKTYVEAIKKIYTEGDDHRLPFQKEHILKFTKSKWIRDTKEGGDSFKFNYLVDMAVIQLYWFTCSRPCEILPTKNNTARGLKFKHVKFVVDKQNGVDILKLQIESYKNQTSHQISKVINISTTTCQQRFINQCSCRYLNPYGLIRKMIKERKKLLQSLKYKREGDYLLTIKQRSELDERIKNLEMGEDNYLFMHSSGKPVLMKNLSELTEEIVNVNDILETQRYKNYSLRIGGTTQASIAGVDHTVILKYVGWKNSRLADCAQRYMRYPDYLLSRVPFEMIHGALKSSQYRRPRNAPYKIYDPWSEKTDFKFYK